MSEMYKKIGIVGFGNMGSAIGERLKTKYQVYTFDKDKNKTRDLLDVNVAKSIEDLVDKVDVIILAVKPQDFDDVLSQCKDNIEHRLVVSIAAGISTGYIERYIGVVRIVRVMPNLPARIGRGMICLCKGNFATQDDLDFVCMLFAEMGQTMVIMENLMDAATAISGSGPGFFYKLIQDIPMESWAVYSKEKFIPALFLSAKEIGFSSEQAELLARVTTEGSEALLKETGLSPAALCRQVVSKGGTTEAGLLRLREVSSLAEATKAALMRARELSKK